MATVLALLIGMFVCRELSAADAVRTIDLDWENAAAENKAAYQEVQDAGKPVHDLTPEQRAAWAEAMRPVWEEFGASQVGEDVMNRLREIGGAG